ncbi:hypothetical protein HC235_05025 [Pyrobaculum arsenaticum]|nr:hypothetical protein [Pyrobaculum arsenaticum]NYR15320.1 hypothetical protein [Pyrobaculum arsenaticum]
MREAILRQFSNHVVEVAVLREGFKYVLISQLLFLVPFAAVLAVVVLGVRLLDPGGVAVFLLFLAAVFAAAAVGFVGLYKLWRGYNAVLGSGNWPARGVLFTFVAVALYIAALPLFLLSPPAGIGLYLSSNAVSLVSYVFVFVLGSKELYDKLKVPEFHKAFILYLFFFLLVPVVVATWLMYRGLGKLGQASAPEFKFSTTP